MEGLWTNRNSLSDFVQNGLQYYQSSVSEVYVAVAFFTEDQVVNDIISSGCHVRMIVRLGFPTRPAALRALINNNNIEIRYYSDSSFHPKLYIFGDKAALLGSANLTRSALLTNQEIVVSIESDDSRFDELTSLFFDYWNESQVLTIDVLDAYELIYSKYGKAINDLSRIDDEIQSKIGKTVYPNINRGIAKKSKKNIFLDDYRRTYQETAAAFEQIKKVYESVGRRKNENKTIPLRLEIDSFFGFLRDVHATHEIWRDQPLGWNGDRKRLLLFHINEWLEEDRPHFDKIICQENYPLITRVFKSPQKINDADYDEIVRALVVLHSFHDRLRFYPGGLNTLIESFKNNNNLNRVKESLSYLLFGKKDIINRMADLIYDETYKLNAFGKANVQELVGWINKEELPVINGRTTKILRYYGFNVRQL